MTGSRSYLEGSQKQRSSLANVSAKRACIRHTAEADEQQKAALSTDHNFHPSTRVRNDAKQPFIDKSLLQKTADKIGAVKSEADKSVAIRFFATKYDMTFRSPHPWATSERNLRSQFRPAPLVHACVAPLGRPAIQSL